MKIEVPDDFLEDAAEIFALRSKQLLAISIIH